MSEEVTGVFPAGPSVVAVGEPFALGVKVLTAPYFTDWKCKYHAHRSVAGPFNRSPRGGFVRRGSRPVSRRRAPHPADRGTPLRDARSSPVWVRGR